MTARIKRAVRSAPGDAPDRRGTIEGERSIPARPCIGSNFMESANPSPTGRSWVVDVSRGVHKGAARPLGIASVVGGVSPRGSGVSPPWTSHEAGNYDRSGVRTVQRRRQFNRTEGSVCSVLYELERHRGSFEILRILSREGPMTRTSIRRRLGPGPGTLDRALRSLVVQELVHLESIRKFPYAKFYGLTERGTRLAYLPVANWPTDFPALP